MPDTLQPLRDAIKSGNAEAIFEALPEPPEFLSVLFTLKPDDRDSITAGVMRVFEQEDQWEVIEAASVDSVVRPERGSFLAVIPMIPAELISDSRLLLSRFSDPDVVRTIQQALDARAEALGGNA
jgi:hypothetical protein